MGGPHWGPPIFYGCVTLIKTGGRSNLQILVDRSSVGGVEDAAPCTQAGIGFVGGGLRTPRP